MTGAVINILIFCLMLIVSFLWEHKRNVVAFTTVKHECPEHLKIQKHKHLLHIPKNIVGQLAAKK